MTAILVASAAAGATGCDEAPATRIVAQGPQPDAAPPIAPPVAAPPTLEPLPTGTTYAGPPVRLAVDRSGDLPVMRVSADVPTGGWKLVFDRCEVDPGREARIYATLVRPAPGIVVTQAQETVRRNWRASAGFLRSKLHVRVLTSGRPEVGLTWDLVEDGAVATGG